MLRPYTPNRKESRSADPRSVRGGAPSFAVTRTLAVDNNPALKAPKSGNGGPFSELGAETVKSVVGKYEAKIRVSRTRYRKIEKDMLPLRMKTAP